MDYVGIKNFPSVTNREFLLDYFGGGEGYKNAIYNWLKNIKEEQLEKFKYYDWRGLKIRIFKRKKVFSAVNTLIC